MWQLTQDREEQRKKEAADKKRAMATANKVRRASLAAIGARSEMKLTPEMEAARRAAQEEKEKMREEEKIIKALQNAKLKKKLSMTGARSSMALSEETEQMRAEAHAHAQEVRRSSVRRMSAAAEAFQKKLNNVTKKIDDSLEIIED